MPIRAFFIGSVMAHILLSRSILDQSIIFKACATYLKKEDKVCIILYSFFDAQLHSEMLYQDYYKKDGTYDLKMRKMFLAYGITEITYLNYYDDNEVTRLKKIHDATILFFPGGAPDEMMRRLNEHHLTQEITSFKGHTIGSSAGAMIHFDTFHIYKDKEYKKFQLLQGLGLIKGFDICVHYQRKIQQHKALKKVRRLRHIDLFVLPDDGAMIVDEGHVTLIHSAKKYSHKKGIIR
jgi:peptidase E